ncbi:MAG TPA: hypothetical protein EYN66_05715, partial [Myxococcales bacterium]|nr:hypothetical protein [Myxococcales bacterium]
MAPQCIALQQGCVPTDGETAAHCQACPEGQYPSGTNAECIENPLADCAGIAQQCMTIQQGCVPTEGDTAAHCQMCPDGQYPSGINAQCVDFEGLASEHDFGTITLAPGEEHNGWCQSWVLNNETELWVNGLEFITQGGYHHSNWFFVPEGKHSYPDKSPWKNCYSKGFSEIDAALSGGVLYAQSTQVAREFQKFPAG